MFYFLLSVFSLLTFGSASPQAVIPLTEPLPKNFSYYDNFLQNSTKSGMWIQFEYPISITKDNGNKRLIHACENGSVFRYYWGQSLLKDKVLDEMDCLNCLIQDWDHLIEDKLSCNKNTTIPIKEFLGRTSKIEDTLLKSTALSTDISYFKNKSEKDQDGYTTSHSRSVTTSTEVAWQAGFQFTSEHTVFLPLATSTIELEVSTSRTSTNGIENSEIMATPPQKVSVPPKSIVKTKWALYKTNHVFRYTVDVEVDDTQDNYNSQRFRKFKELWRTKEVKGDLKESTNKTFIDFSGEKIILRNVPFEERVTGYSVVFEIDTPQNISDFRIPFDSDIFEI